MTLRAPFEPVILTGDMQVGKSTFVRQIIDSLDRSVPAGFYTCRIEQDGEVTGHALCGWSGTGESAIKCDYIVHEQEHNESAPQGSDLPVGPVPMERPRRESRKILKKLHSLNKSTLPQIYPNGTSHRFSFRRVQASGFLFDVDRRVFESFGVEMLQQAFKASWYVLDELGVMEQGCSAFETNLRELAKNGRPGLIVVQRRALNYWHDVLALKQWQPVVLNDTTDRQELLRVITEYFES